MSATSRVPEHRLLLVLQVVGAASAIGSLPRGLIHPLWILTFVAPAALCLFLGSGPRRRLVPIWARFVLAGAAQAGAAYLARFYVGHLGEEAWVPCSLLPFLTFFTLRREPSDTGLSLFLGFCFLFIGIHLNQKSADWTLLVFLLACSWAMQIEASQRALTARHAARGQEMSLGSKILRRTQVIAALMLVAFLVYQGIDLIPSPSRGPIATATSIGSDHSNRRQIGLSSRFDLSGAEGLPIQLADDEAIRVKHPGARPVPADLYLRAMYFDRGHPIEWTRWPHDAVESGIDPRGFSVWQPRDRIQRHSLLVERLAPPQDGEMFVPPGTERITGIRRMVFDKRAGFFKSTDANDMGYGVTYRRPHKLRLRQGIDPELTRRGAFRALPRSLRTPELVALAAELGGAGARGMPPMDLARGIAAGLQERCRYRLRDPEGPYDDALHNFLFSAREGYCMHFAAALAVLLRIQGVPCRIAAGFHAGTPEPDGNGRIFGSRHAHAWVELPLERTGWTLVDPTPPGDRAQHGWPAPLEQDLARPDPAGSGADAAPRACFLDGLRDPLANSGAMLVFAFVFVAVSLGLVVYLLRRTREQQGPSGARKPTADAARARRMLQQILIALARGGHPKHHSATLEQFLRALDERQREGLDVPALAGAFRAYQEVRFGAKELDEEREARLAAGVSTARD